MAIIDQVFTYVRDHPQCLSREIEDYLESASNRGHIRDVLSKLVKRKEVFRIGVKKPFRYAVQEEPPDLPPTVESDGIRISDLRDLIDLVYKQRAEINQLRAQIDALKYQRNHRKVTDRDLEDALAIPGD